jgi:7-cyano-7-deazaguanine reductase
MATHKQTKHTLLGKKVSYPETYTASLLEALPRPNKLKGVDRWLCYEVSCLDSLSKPLVFVLEINIDSCSDYIVESKSLKLYLNSLNFLKTTQAQLIELISHDINTCLKTKASYSLHALDSTRLNRQALAGVCIDDADMIEGGLFLEDIRVSETLYSHVFRSNCPVTNQPDWASIVVTYSGKKINEASLLSYLVSFRAHQGFHESCVDTVFQDILALESIESLSVSGYFTRRGGIDITPFRTTLDAPPRLYLTHRQ